MNTTGDNYNLIPISVVADTDKPLSFQVWKNNFEIILPEQAYAQYNDYLINWYKNKKTEQNDLSTQIKINFLNLLKQIQVYFTEEEKESWYAGIDVDSEKEVLLAIPYFARKLKNISLYYLNLREQIKKSKLKYNLAGSNKSVVKQIQDIILQNYAKKDNAVISLPSTLWSHLPQLSSIKNNFVIEVEELYDTASYFDRSVSLPASAYFPIENETEKYFLSKGINLSAIDWVYRLGTFTVSALNDSRLQGTVDTSLTSLYVDLTEKYLGNSFYTSLVTTASTKKDFYTIDIVPGNNFFNYPYGSYKLNVTGLPRYKPVALSATSLQTLGTAGSSIELADTIFVKTEKGVEGAWFRKKILDVANINMKATIEGNTSTIFRFPYPGYGISAEDVEWSGYSSITDPRYFYLDDNVKKQIEQVYWNSSFSLSGVVPIPINSTSLINNGAYSSTDFNVADKIRIWPTPPQFNSSSYTGDVQEAWLYKFLETNISVGSNTDNTIVWPYYKIFSPEDQVLPDLPYNICLSEKLSGISLPFATGSDVLSSADVVYKINNYQDTKENAVECAWLSAANYYYPNSQTYGPRQTHFSAIFKPGTYTSFIWDYSDKTDINTIINGSVTHASDCKFISTPNTTYKDYNLCTCKQTYFAPFGHPGNSFYDNNGLCDFIVEDPNYIPQNNFDINNWKDSKGLPFSKSPAACWFKTQQNIGWGYGTWYSGATTTGNTFFLRRGKRYIYYRANTRDENTETKSYPELVVRQVMPINNKFKGTWIRAVKDKDNNWVSTGKPSELTINSNDLLIYSRPESTYFNITGNYTAEQKIAENRGSIWSTFDYISVNNTNTFISISFPTLYSKSLPLTTANLNDPYNQYPDISPNSIAKISRWEITDPSGNTETYINQPIATFAAAATGLYTVKVTAITAAQNLLFTPAATGCYYFSNIPPITCVPDFIEVPTLSTFSMPIPGFILKTKLKGWNYTTNTRSTLQNDLVANNIGALPIWVKSNIDKNYTTDFKSIESWSPALSFYDSYNPVTFYDVSDITLKGGEYVEYKRKPQTKIIWNENITINNKTNTNQWCKLETKLNTNIASFNPSNNLISNPTTEPSTLLLQNVVENKPVEIYYNALNLFTWNITAEPQITETIYSAPISSTALIGNEPWANLTNQFNPTVAFLPTLDTLTNTKHLGGYFKPSNLGLLTYVNKDYTYELNLSSINTNSVYSSPSKKIKSRGLTREEQFSPYSITLENNTWLKEPYTTGSLAGTIKKSTFKKYQKFVPYQSTYESNPLTRIGLITPVSRQHPWTGPQDTNWADPTNRPINFTGEINVSHWVKDQVLKNTTLLLDNWCTDIYGNQYGLYKETKNTTPSQRTDTPGQLWIRKNSQQTEPAYTALSGIFDTYSAISLYNELTGSGIYKIDTFYDTLMIETSGSLIFEKVIYDYNEAKIFSIADSARGISLLQPTQNNLNREFTNTLPAQTLYGKVGDTWFFAKEKIVIISVIELQNSNVIPNLYSLDLNKNILKKVFTIPDTEQTFNSLNIIEVSKPVLSYCSTKKQFLYTFTCKDFNNKDIIISLYINNELELTLNNIQIYTAQPPETLPPIITTDPNISFRKEVRTNLLTYSEQFDNSSWSKLNCSIISNAIEAPDGTKTADKITYKWGSYGYLTRSFTFTAGTTYRMSLFAKAAERNSLVLLAGLKNLYNNTGNNVFCTFKLNTQTVTTSRAEVTGRILNVGNGWFWCSLDFTPTSTVTNAGPQFARAAIATQTALNIPETGVYIWGAQLETGPLPSNFTGTTYVGTSASQVTEIGRTFINQQLIAQPQTNCTFESINFPSWANLSQTGLFTALIPNKQLLYNLEIKAINSSGFTHSSLIIDAT